MGQNHRKKAPGYLSLNQTQVGNFTKLSYAAIHVDRYQELMTYNYYSH